jgi:serine/threonine protein kinase
MTPERWEQVKEIFNSAIKYSHEERKLFLAQACSNDVELRGEVESLIASHERSGDFIDEPAYQLAAKSLVDERSELKAGQRIQSYEILKFISRGGMGEVYLAQDKRLNRKVALKVLPSSFTRDNDRLRRFEQEARAASALNHPNIITIYEILQTDSTHVIVTEFVEGETLRQRLARTPLRLVEAIAIASQIADALSAAHKAGIIHRDIKPENVMLRPDGYIKVLDFGLAKLNEDVSQAVALEAPTMQVRTGSGIVIGTAGYMSPEQARGVSVDERSDIFSLGTVIYEMVGRRKPFDGETPSDTLASILKTEPPTLLQLDSRVPPELNRIVTKSLRKDREERYQVVKELLLDLRALKQELDFQSKLETSSVPDQLGDSELHSTQGSATAREMLAHDTESRSAITLITESLSLELKRHKLGTGVFLAAIALIAGLAGFGLYKYFNRARPVEHFWNIKLTRLTSSGNVIDATISPDGKYIVYVLSSRSNQSLWIRQVSTANDKQIVEPASVGYFGITFSPDGNDLYYVLKTNLDTGSLYRIPVFGGVPVKLGDSLDGPISFAPDGKRFVLIRGNYPTQNETALVVKNVDGGAEQALVVKKNPERFSPLFFTGPSWSADGKLIAATVSTVGGSCRVVAFSVSDGKEVFASKEDWSFSARVWWLPDMTGLLVVAGDNPGVAQHWIVSYPSGERRRITNDLSAYRAIGLTADGEKMTTVQAAGLINLWLVPGNRAADAVSLSTGNIGFYASAGNNVSWTPNGQIAFVSNEAGNADIWLTDPDGKNRRQLTSNGSSNLTPTVSPDGRYIVFVSTRATRRNLWRINIDGSNPIQLTNGLSDSYPSFTPDGKWVIYTSVDNFKPSTFKVSINGGNATPVSNHVATLAVVSPDGKWLAFTYPSSADSFAPPNRLVITPFESNDGSKPIEFQLSPSGTVLTLIQWSADSQSVFYTINNYNTSNIWSQALSGGPPKQLTDFKDSLMTSFAYSRDGKMLACTRGILLRDAVLITDMK